MMKIENIMARKGSKGKRQTRKKKDGNRYRFDDVDKGHWF